MSKKDTFDEYKELLQKIDNKYGENPRETVRELRKAVKSLSYYDNEFGTNNSAIKKYGDKDFHILDFDYYTSQIFVYIVSLIILALMFIFQIGGSDEGLPMYIFGMVFLAAGQSIGTFVPVFGLIFLFSHGGTGMGIMVGSFLTPILENPVMTDNPPQSIILYIGTAIALIVIGFLITVIRNLSKSFKEKYYSIFLPILFYIIGMGMLVVLYKNFDMIYKMMI